MTLVRVSNSIYQGAAFKVTKEIPKKINATRTSASVGDDVIICVSGVRFLSESTLGPGFRKECFRARVTTRAVLPNNYIVAASSSSKLPVCC